MKPTMHHQSNSSSTLQGSPESFDLAMSSLRSLAGTLGTILNVPVSSIGTNLSMSTAYHSKSDGKTKRVNQVMEDMLRMYCLEQPSKWHEYLPLVEFSYNNTFHSSIEMTPFNALYDHEVVSLATWFDLHDRVEVSHKMLESMEE